MAAQAQQIEQVSVSAEHGSEKIIVGTDVLASLPSQVRSLLPTTARFALVMDTSVSKLYADKIKQAFASTGIELLVKEIPPGEVSKTREIKETIEDFLLSHACNRDTCLIAVGGGVVGDLTGYVAATFLRGVPVIQVPTTILAMVDSAIGGKTGVNTPAGKNLIGSFHHPTAIFIDISFLRSLPQREFCNGLAEVIKTAAIWDEQLFEFLENNVDKILDRQEDVLKHIILQTASIKAKIVSMDDRENGIRSILNFGHTIGHAIESLTSPDLLHGECVAIGMVLETKMADKASYLVSSSLTGRLIRCISAFQLPIHLPKYLKMDDLMRKMSLDKKNAGNKVRTIMLKRIGEAVDHPIAVEADMIRSILSPSISVAPTVVNGHITVPGSKSISNRVLILASLGVGQCKIEQLLHADDTHVMLDSLHQLGVSFKWEDNGETLVLQGSSGKFTAPSKPLFLSNAGTASRFLTTMTTLVKEGSTKLTGISRLKERPIKDLTESLSDNGIGIKYLEKDGFFPFEIAGGGLPGGHMSLSADISSQFVSSVLMSAPYANKAITLQLKGQAVSRPFIEMTILLMKQFGIDIHRVDENTFQIPQGVYKNPAKFVVESDASSASYPLAMAAMTGGEVTVDNIGSNSLQGDAQFYTVLEKMGCQVKQTESSTTVKGPASGVLQAVNVDMSSMTDTFMTAAVLAAVAKGTSKIYNIANQRVKECNRIAVMVSELGKCGIAARELEDGIEIDGCNNDLTHVHGADIECHNDHRIAMSFAVLGLKVPGIALLDKECVDKTYPEFWSDIEKKFKVPLITPEKKGSSLVSGEDARTLSIIITGMRASAKSTMGNALASAPFANRKFIDLDVAFSDFVGCPINEYIEKNGWPQFRKKEEELLRKVLTENRHGHVISTGGGIVETPACRTLLANFPGPVIQLTRDIEDIDAYLSTDKTRANLGKDIRSVWTTRKPLFRESAKHEFYMRKGDLDWKSIEKDFFNFSQNLLGRHQQVHDPKSADELITSLSSSFFLSMTYGNMQDAIAVLPVISEGVQALELRVDLLENHSEDFVRDQVAILRRHSSLPIIFTVRSVKQGGKFPGNEKEMFDLLHLGVRLQCEFVDMETCWSKQAQDRLVSNKLHSRIIASYHNFEKPATSTTIIQEMFDRCFQSKADIVKVVGLAESSENCFLLREVARKYQSKGVPIIALLAGEAGKLSRVVNKFMTPVTHPSLPSAAAPGQLSVKEILALRQQLSI